MTNVYILTMYGRTYEYWYCTYSKAWAYARTSGGNLGPAQYTSTRDNACALIGADAATKGAN